MSVIFDEVVTEIEPATRPTGASSATQSEAEGGEAVPSDQELARRITRLLERKQRLAAD